MASLHCVITSPEGLVYEGNVRSVVVPAVDGELGILSRHAPLVGMLGAGELRVEAAEGGKKTRYFLDGGFVQVLKNRVTVLATQIEGLEGLSKAAAEQTLNTIKASPPARSAGLEARDAWNDRAHIAARRVKLFG